MQAKIQIANDPKKATKRLLSVLPERSRTVLTLRFGLGKNTKRATLEAIGQEYGITRERVRQIENGALAAIRDSEAFALEDAAFKELRGVLLDMGCIVAEDDLLNALSSNQSVQNHLHFLLVVGGIFEQGKESDDFTCRWSADSTVATEVEAALARLYESIGDTEILSEAALVDRFLEELRDLNEQYKNEEVLKRWLKLYKHLGRNPLGEWGRATSPAIRVKGIRDYAYLAMKRHGSPMHFTEVAKAISDLFGKRAHTATCHNELIKDKRFVLIGRGLYALTEWGYSRGVVREVIRDILEKEGPLTREEVIDRVKKERYVKDNTILVNLNDRRYFARGSDGSYTPVR